MKQQQTGKVSVSHRASEQAALARKLSASEFAASLESWAHRSGFWGRVHTQELFNLVSMYELMFAIPRQPAAHMRELRSASSKCRTGSGRRQRGKATWGARKV